MPYQLWSQDNFSKVEESVSNITKSIGSVIETVNLIANQPSAEPIEKEVVNLSLINVPKDVKESQSYRVMQYAINNK